MSLYGFIFDFVFILIYLCLVHSHCHKIITVTTIRSKGETLDDNISQSIHPLFVGTLVLTKLAAYRSDNGYETEYRYDFQTDFSASDVPKPSLLSIASHLKRRLEGRERCDNLKPSTWSYSYSILYSYIVALSEVLC